MKILSYGEELLTSPLLLVVHNNNSGTRRHSLDRETSKSPCIQSKKGVIPLVLVFAAEGISEENAPDLRQLLFEGHRQPDIQSVGADDATLVAAEHDTSRAATTVNPCHYILVVPDFGRVSSEFWTWRKEELFIHRQVTFHIAFALEFSLGRPNHRLHEVQVLLPAQH